MTTIELKTLNLENLIDEISKRPYTDIDQKEQINISLFISLYEKLIFIKSNIDKLNETESKSLKQMLQEYIEVSDKTFYSKQSNRLSLESLSNALADTEKISSEIAFALQNRRS